MVVRKTNWELKPGHLHHKQTHYQPSYCTVPKGGSFYQTYEVTVNKVKNKTVCNTETVC